VLAFLLAGCGTGEPHHRPIQRETLGRIAPSPAERECLADLGAHHAAFIALPDEYLGAGCATLNTVRLYSVGGDSSDIAVTNLAQVGCPMAKGFASWVRYGVDRAARDMLGSPVVRVETMGSFACRNIAGTERLSTHATASAIDVSGFVLADGRRITVLGDWNAGMPETRYFLRMVHESACKRFGTVLGPDYNAAHRNHLHIDISPTPYCR
jgi:hypothetical protein